MTKVEQVDRDAAAEIARFYLGNGDTLSDDLRSGKAARHFTLDVLANHRIKARDRDVSDSRKAVGFEPEGSQPGPKASPE